VTTDNFVEINLPPSMAPYKNPAVSYFDNVIGIVAAS
jgi:hypothetical protein